MENTILKISLGAIAVIAIAIVSMAVAYALITPPIVLQVSSNGNVLIRGNVSSVSQNSITLKSWGGVWIINITANTQLLPKHDMSQFKVGDFVGVQGTVDKNNSLTINATMVRDWNPVASKGNSQCTYDSDCTSGMVCVGHVCVTKDPLPPISNCAGPDQNGNCPAGCVNYGEPLGCVTADYWAYCNNHKGECPICLASNTSIATPNGEINVKDIKVGMQVWSKNRNGQRIKSTVIKISNTVVPSTHKVVHLILSDKREVWVSPNHPTVNGLPVGSLKVGDTYDGAVVQSAQLIPYWDAKTYDILPDSDTGSYWANGILLDSTLY